MRIRTLILPLLLLVAFFASACSGGADPVASPSATEAPSKEATEAADGMALAIANLQEEPDPLTEAEAICVAELVGEDRLALVDFFSEDFKNTFDEADDPSEIENGEEIGELLFDAAAECLEDGVGLDCETGGEAGDACNYGDDPDLDALYDDCIEGDLNSCDELYFTSAVGSEYESFAQTCGGLSPVEDQFGTCVEEFGEGDEFDSAGEDFATQVAGIDCSTVDGPCEYGDDAALDALWDACETGDFNACDELYFDSPFDSVYEAFGDTCGDRQAGGLFCGDERDGDADTAAGEIDCSEVDGPCDYGDDAYFDALWDECEAGNGASCDALYQESPLGSRYEQYGDTCGDRGYEPSCEDVYGGGGR